MNVQFEIEAVARIKKMMRKAVEAPKTDNGNQIPQ
jgi:hypothetical protein